jgi:hypothetical protein
MVLRAFEVVIPGFAPHELFDQAIFEGLKADHRQSTTGGQQTERALEAGLHRGQLIIGSDPQSLEAAGGRVGRSTPPGADPLDELGQLAGGRERAIAALRFYLSGDLAGVTLIAQFPKKIRQFAGREGVDEVCGGWAFSALIHAHVQRTVFLEGESALGRVELMGTHTEIEQDSVEGSGSDPLVRLAEIALVGFQPFGVGLESVTGG